LRLQIYEFLIKLHHALTFFAHFFQKT